MINTARLLLSCATYQEPDLLEKKRYLKNLKNLGYKVYSRYENDNKDEYGLFIGPTLEKEDSFNVVDELKNISGYNPEVQKYD